MIRELSWEAYRALDAVNPSILRTVSNDSLFHALYELKNPKQPTPDMIKGTIAHLLLFEPGRFAEFVYRFDTGESKNTKAWRTFLEECEAKNKIPLHADDEDEIQAWVEAVGNSKKCSALIKLEGTAEASLLWTDEATGLACKTRLDKYVPRDIPLILEFKTATSLDEHTLQNQAINHGWDIAAAMRIDGHVTEYKVRPEYWFIVVEKKPPYTVIAYKCFQCLETYGRYRYRKAITAYAEAKRTGHWPSYSATGAMELRAPIWALKELAENGIEVNYGE